MRKFYIEDLIDVVILCERGQEKHILEIKKDNKPQTRKQIGKLYDICKMLNNE